MIVSSWRHCQFWRNTFIHLEVCKMRNIILLAKTEHEIAQWVKAPFWAFYRAQLGIYLKHVHTRENYKKKHFRVKNKELNTQKRRSVGETVTSYCCVALTSWLFYTAQVSTSKLQRVTDASPLHFGGGGTSLRVRVCRSVFCLFSSSRWHRRWERGEVFTSKDSSVCSLHSILDLWSYTLLIKIQRM